MVLLIFNSRLIGHYTRNKICVCAWSEISGRFSCSKLEYALATRQCAVDGVGLAVDGVGLELVAVVVGEFNEFGACTA